MRSQYIVEQQQFDEKEKKKKEGKGRTMRLNREPCPAAATDSFRHYAISSKDR